MTTSDDTIVKVKIHPAIGLARVGNSEEYLLAPETPHPENRKEQSYYCDDAGKLKRQAVRFRIYGYNENDEVVREITVDEE